jgi:uncharacterized tellurite resistance protein B-like protein
MNFSDFITNHGKSVNKDNYINLIQVSKSDGRIDPSELEMLHKEGKKFGLTDPEIDILIKEESSHQYHAPYSLHEKFEQLYNVAVLILADDIISESERKMIKKFAIVAGFEDKKIDRLIELLFTGVKNNDSEESLFSKFKHELFN